MGEDDDVTEGRGPLVHADKDPRTDAFPVWYRAILSFMEASAPLVRATVWPALAIIVIILVRVPLQHTLELLPGIVSRSSEITVSGVTFQIDRRLQGDASPQLRSALAGISGDGLAVLIRIGKEPMLDVSSGFLPFMGDVEVDPALEELERRGLIVLAEDEELFGPRWITTELGEEAYTFVLDIILQELLGAQP